MLNCNRGSAKQKDDPSHKNCLATVPSPQLANPLIRGTGPSHRHAISRARLASKDQPKWSLKTPSRRELAPSDGHTDLTRQISPIEALDWNAFEIKTYGIVRRIIDDITSRWPWNGTKGVSFTAACA